MLAEKLRGALQKALDGHEFRRVVLRQKLRHVGPVRFLQPVDLADLRGHRSNGNPSPVVLVALAGHVARLDEPIDQRGHSGPGQARVLDS